MGKVALMLILLSSTLLWGQKIVKKTILNPTTSFVQIDATNCSNVNIFSGPKNEVVIKATIDGEYKKDLLLQVVQKGTGVSIHAGFQPLFKNPNDKLSAHKVVSIALDITVPHHKKVHLFGTETNVTVNGAYNDLKVTLDDGRCELRNVSESVQVQTQRGDIIVHARNARIRALSTYGHIENDSIPTGNNCYKLTTTTGNIYLMKTE